MRIRYVYIFSVTVFVLSYLSTALAAEDFVKDSNSGVVEAIDVSSYPEIMQQRYQLLKINCVKCHSLSAVTDAPYVGEQWKASVKRMSRRPGSGISPVSSKEIYEFLKYYSEQ